MSLQTNVFENGRWVTRSLDPYHVRARNTRPQEGKTAFSSTSPLKAPSLGLLTRTLIRSSVTKWIIPARIRHKTKNDVLFISAGAVTIKEASGNYTVRNVAVKDDFHSPIRAAKILGETRDHDEGDKYNAVDRDVTTFTATRSALTGRIYGDWPTRIAERQTSDNVMYHPRELPPHVLVLALESNQLVFMCGVNGLSDQPRLLSSHRPLPAARSPNERFGQFIAVDPKSRAMAVAAREKVVYLYALKSMSVMREELHKASSLCPIKEERLIWVEGVILRMEFLHPPLFDTNLIILLLTVSRDGKSWMVWYDWNSGKSLRESELRATRYALPQEESLPLLLIPLINFTTFMLVCKKRITLYKDLLTGTPIRYVQRLENEEEPEEPGSSKTTPLWTQWARPMRTGEFRLKDAFYLCREDGIVQYLEFHNNVDHVLNSSHQAGRLKVRADTAFAVLDVGPNTRDLIVVAGDESEGGLWRVGPRTDTPILVEAISNWTPLNNLIILSSSNEKREIFEGTGETGLAFPTKGPQRVFACTGTNGHGAVSELRYGIQASTLIDICGEEVQDMVRSGVLGIWAFHGFFGDTEFQFQGQEERLKDVTYILISHPTQTSLLFMPLEQDPAFVDDPNLDLRASTIFASITVKGHLVQVTERSIVLSSMSRPELVLKQEHVDDDDTKHKEFEYQYRDSHIWNKSCASGSSTRNVAACMYSDHSDSILLTSFQDNGQFYLCPANVDTKYERRGEAWLLNSQSSCLHMLKVDRSLLAFVATVDGKLSIFIVGEHDLVFCKAYTFLDGSYICDSMTIITSTIGTSREAKYLVVCGLRNGLVQTFSFTKEDSHHSLTLCETLHLGNTSVTVMTDTTRKDRVICHCERSLLTLEYPEHSLYTAPATVRNIWTTDYDQPPHTRSTTSAITQAVHSWLPEQASGFASGALISTDDRSLQTFKLNLDREAQMVPRRLTMGGSPEQVVYSRYIDKLIVLCNRIKILKAPQGTAFQKASGTRIFEPTIRFLDPDAMTGNNSHLEMMDEERTNQPSANDRLLAYERHKTEKFVGIVEWFVMLGNHVWHMLVVHTQLTLQSKEQGRLLLFKIDKSANGEPSLTVRKRIRLPEPLHYVAVYPDRKSLIYCSGNHLCIESLHVTPKGLKLQHPIATEMRSPLRYLSVSAPYIYVSSRGESLVVYKYEDEKLTYLYGDQSARPGLYNLHVPEHSLVLASDSANTVIGLWQPPERRIDNAMIPLFEAVLPGSITCLARVTKPIWCRDVGEPQADSSIIGSSADGTITQFDILTKGWRLLRFIQNMAERNQIVCPFKGRGPFKRQVEPSTSKPHYMHINGDILQRVVERGGEQLIGAMLDVRPNLESHTDFETASARWDRFRELAGEVVDVEEGDWMASVVQWVRYRLRSAL